jgi:hypothetical protein
MAALAGTSCVEPLKESGRPCPCTGAWACSYYQGQICVPRAEACTPPVASVTSGVLVESDGAACSALVEGGVATLIDDFESQDLEIHRGGVNGKWATFNDGSGGCGSVTPDIAPIPGGRCGSRFAMRLTATGLSDWGADVGFLVNVHDMTSLPLDTTAYTGIQFWAKSGSVPFGFQFKLVDVTGDPAGMECTPDAGTMDPRACFVPFLKERTVDTDWAFYQFPFSDLPRATPIPGAASKPRLDQVYQLLWGIPPDTTPDEWRQFILWIDDVAWYR